MYKLKIKTGYCTVCGLKTDKTKYCSDRCMRERKNERVREYLISHPKEHELIKKKQKEYREINKKKISERHKLYLRKNKSYVSFLRRRRYKRQYVPRKNHVNKWTPEYTRQYQNRFYKEHYRKNPSQKIAQIFRQRIWRLVKGRFVKYKIEKLIGCSKEFLIEYIESKFRKGMSWKNHSKFGWHIDHIIPCVKFDLTNDDELKKCFHHTNLQPLWYMDNLRKSGKILPLETPKKIFS